MSKRKFFKPNRNQDQSQEQPIVPEVVKTEPEQEKKGVKKLPDHPVVIEADDTFEVVVIEFVDGLKYRLQHPGVRTYLKWRDSMIDISEVRYNSVELLENFFEHCCFPEGHDFRPNLDNILPKHLSAWQEVATRFLSGNLEP